MVLSLKYELEKTYFHLPNNEEISLRTTNIINRLNKEIIAVLSFFYLLENGGVMVKYFFIKRTNSFFGLQSLDGSNFTRIY